MPQHDALQIHAEQKDGRQQQELQVLERVEAILKEAKSLGADSAEVSASLSTGFEVTVRQGELDKVQFNRNQDFAITLYRGHAKGSAGATDASAEGIREAVAAAWHIACHIEKDPCAGLADASQMATEAPNLDLHRPWEIGPDDAKTIALEMEAAAKAVDSRITNSGGATVATAQNCGAYSNTHGFSAVVFTTRHSLDCAVIASAKDEMQQDYWYTVARWPSALEEARAVGRRAGERAVARLGAQPVKTAAMPVLLAAPAAVSLISHLLGAMSGGNLYRKASFLLDSLGTQVLPKGYSLYEHPYKEGALGSAGFDADGLATREQTFIQEGRLDRYVLSTYSARRLDMQSTANAGGVHNLEITNDGLDLDALLAETKDGIYITELMGQGVNLVTGDYSRGASGFLVESGKITRPVQGITIAGNLKEVLMHIRAIGSDIEKRGNLLVGSVLIDGFTVAGT